jgi:hypothetical protein
MHRLQHRDSIEFLRAAWLLYPTRFRFELPETRRIKPAAAAVDLLS